MDLKEAETPPIEYKVFTFKEKRKNSHDTLTVSIPEAPNRKYFPGAPIYDDSALVGWVTALICSQVLDPQYGMYVWPCAVVLAQYLWTQRGELRDKTVLELGAGVSLPGVVAAKCGAKVILSDSGRTPLCLENCRRSCEANGLQDVEVMDLTWGEISPDVVRLPKLDIILGSDVFYEPQDFEDILVTIAFLLRKSPNAQFWTTYQERSADWSIEVLLNRWKLSCVEIHLETFNANKSELAGSTLPGRHGIQMMIITRKTEVAEVQQTECFPDD